jgi:hypothetical protein
LTSLNLTLEAAGSGARASEDGSTVSILICVDHVNGLVDGLDIQADKHRTKYLLLVALHVGLDVGDDRGANLQFH